MVTVPNALILMSSGELGIPFGEDEVQWFTDALARSLTAAPGVLSEDEAADALMGLAVVGGVAVWAEGVELATRERLVDAFLHVFNSPDVRDLEGYDLFWDTICRPSGHGDAPVVKELLTRALHRAEQIGPYGAPAVKLGLERLQQPPVD